MAPRRQGIAERGKCRDEPWRGRSEVGRQNDLALHLAVLWSQVGGEPSGGRAPPCSRRQGWELGRQSNPYRPIRSRIVRGPAQGAATEPRSSPGGRKVGGRRCWQRHPEKGKGPGSPTTHFAVSSMMDIRMQSGPPKKGRAEAGGLRACALFSSPLLAHRQIC